MNTNFGKHILQPDTKQIYAIPVFLIYVGLLGVYPLHIDQTRNQSKYSACIPNV